MKQRKILFFINGSSPSDDELNAANELGGNVCFRNALADDGRYVESCDAVAGNVPRQYDGVDVVADGKQSGDADAPDAPDAADQVEAAKPQRGRPRSK